MNLGSSGALLRSYCIERRRRLLYVYAAAVWAPDLLPIMFLQGKRLFKGFVAIITDVVVHGHGTPPGVFPEILARSIPARAVIISFR